MAWYQGAVKKEIRPGQGDPPIIPIGVILHTDAGNSASLYNYFNGPSGGIESHFHIPKVKPVEQYRDTGYEADANLKANSFWVDGKRYGFISVETQGLAGDPWTDYQLTEIKKLILWAKSVHPQILLRVCPGPFSAGIGYHTLFGSPSPWTPVAKSCPGPVRIKQFNTIIVPWLKTATPPTEDWFDMATLADLEAALKKVVPAIVADELNKQDVDLWINGTGKSQVIDPIQQIKALLEGMPVAVVKQLMETRLVDMLAPYDPDTDPDGKRPEIAYSSHIAHMPTRVAQVVNAPVEEEAPKA
jgi:hypothetical protein